jgi:hypothetical protein
MYSNRRSPTSGRFLNLEQLADIGPPKAGIEPVKRWNA